MITEQHPPKIYYFDHAATSWPKPPEVIEAMQLALESAGGNAGRGGHQLAKAASSVIYDARETVADFFGCDDPFRVAFASNITESVNLVMQGLLKPGDHVLVTPMEHNAVMRPLTALQKRGVTWEVLPCFEDGSVDLYAAKKKIRKETRLMVICHESNVNGVIQPVRSLGELAREAGILMLVDTAQSAGHMPINIETDLIDFLAFTGHKGLMGPTGTGGVVFGSRVSNDEISPLIYGGTGSYSESIEQPLFLPDRFESGTQDCARLAGLSAGIHWVKDHNRDGRMQATQNQMMSVFIGLLKQIPNLSLYTAANLHMQGDVLSITIAEVDNGLAAEWLDSDCGIMVRTGLHCAPMAHRTLGTFPSGTIRLSISPLTTIEEIETCVAAVNTFATDPAVVLKAWDNRV